MPEPHVIIGANIAPGGPTAAAGGASPAAANHASQPDIPATASTSTVTPEPASPPSSEAHAKRPSAGAKETHRAKLHPARALRKPRPTIRQGRAADVR